MAKIGEIVLVKWLDSSRVTDWTFDEPTLNRFTHESVGFLSHTVYGGAYTKWIHSHSEILQKVRALPGYASIVKNVENSYADGAHENDDSMTHLCAMGFRMGLTDPANVHMIADLERRLISGKGGAGSTMGTENDSVTQPKMDIGKLAMGIAMLEGGVRMCMEAFPELRAQYTNAYVHWNQVNSQALQRIRGRSEYVVAKQAADGASKNGGFNKKEYQNDKFHAVCAQNLQTLNDPRWPEELSSILGPDVNVRTNDNAPEKKVDPKLATEFWIIIHKNKSKDDIASLRRLLDDGVSANIKDEHGWTALGDVVWNATLADHGDNRSVTGELAAIDQLISKGADLEQGGSGMTPLDMAARNGANSVATHLIDKGAKISGAQGGEALYYSTRRGTYEVTEMLIRRGADVNYANADGETPLHNAVINEDMKTIQFLLKQDAKINAENSEGVTPIHDAVRNANKAEIELLLGHGANINARDSDGNTPLAWAKGHRAGGDEFLNEDHTPHPEIIDFLAKRGATE